MVNTLVYYTMDRCKQIFNAVVNPQWRIWKTIDYDGTCRQNGRIISTPRKLLSFIKKAKNPKALYVSVSEFLNPNRNHGNFRNQKITTKNGYYFYPGKGYLSADCILLDSYFFVDLDSETDLKIAQEDGRKIIKFMKSGIWPKFYKLHMIQFSGKKGVHLIYKSLTKLDKDPFLRIRNEIDDKDDIAVHLLQKLNLNTIDRTHLAIMKDVFRVYASPYSIKANGNMVQPLDIDDFMNKDIYTLLSGTTGEFQKEAAIEAKANDSKVAIARGKPLATPTESVEKRDGLSSQPIYYKFMDNMVNGLKNNYITVVKKTISKFNLNKLKEIQKLYNLSDFYIVKSGNYIYAYNFKVLQFERLAKVLKSIKSENLSYFLTRRHSPLPISYSVYKDKELARGLEFLGILKSEYAQHDNHSKPHCRFFNMKYENMVGNAKNNIGTAMVS